MNVVHRVARLVFAHTGDEKGIGQQIPPHTDLAHVPAYGNKILVQVQRFGEHNHLAAGRGGGGKGRTADQIGGDKYGFFHGKHAAFEAAALPGTCHALEAAHQKEAGDKSGVVRDDRLQLRKLQPFGGGDLRFEPWQRQQLSPT